MKKIFFFILLATTTFSSYSQSNKKKSKQFKINHCTDPNSYWDNKLQKCIPYKDTSNKKQGVICADGITWAKDYNYCPCSVTEILSRKGTTIVTESNHIGVVITKYDSIRAIEESIIEIVHITDLSINQKVNALKITFKKNLNTIVTKTSEEYNYFIDISEIDNLISTFKLCLNSSSKSILFNSTSGIKIESSNCNCYDDNGYLITCWIEDYKSSNSSLHIRYNSENIKTLIRLLELSKEKLQ